MTTVEWRSRTSTNTTTGAAHLYVDGAPHCRAAESGSMSVTMVPVVELTSHGVPYGTVCVTCERHFRRAVRAA